jgi:carboxyl-terminal processing protease
MLGTSFGRNAALLHLLALAVLLPPAVSLAAQATPTAPGVADATRRYLSHPAGLTAEIPASWQPDRTLAYDYAGADGFIATVSEYSQGPGAVDERCTSLAADALFDGRGTVTPTRWRGQLACRVVATGDAPLGPMALVFTHPQPIEGPSTTVAVITDAAHFAAITASISLDPAAVTPAAYLDAALAYLETRSLWRDAVDWPAVRQRAHALTSHAMVWSQTYLGIELAIDAIRAAGGDAHTELYVPPRDPGQLAPPNGSGLPAGQVVAEDLGYIALPGFPGSGVEAAAYVATAQEIIAHAEAANPCGWLIDLRGNEGGNMEPMLMAVTPFLLPGTPVGFADVIGQHSWVHLDEDGTWSVDGVPFDIPVRSAPPRAVSDHRPVGVLIGPATASAGERTAIALISQPQTRLFGARSADLATARSGVPLYDGAMLPVADAWVIDAHGGIYPDGIAPDVPVVGDTRSASPNDAVAQAAAAWLQAQPGCTGS